jgi:hypothetical protein
LLREVPTALPADEKDSVTMVVLVRLVLAGLQMRNSKVDMTQYYLTRSTGKEVGVGTALRLDVLEILTLSGCLETE